MKNLKAAFLRAQNPDWSDQRIGEEMQCTAVSRIP